MQVIVGYLMAITPICIAAFVAWVALRQSQINKDKLRLDLYNRRFDIYSKTLDFYHALQEFDPSVASKESFNVLHKSFIKAYRESQFLFDEESGIYAILGEMHSKSFQILAPKERGKELAHVDPPEFLKMYDLGQDAQQWFEAAIQRLEKAMARYLNFQKLSA